MLSQIAAAAIGLAIICGLFAALALMADIHDRYTRKQQREGWRAHRAYMDSLEPKRWNR